MSRFILLKAGTVALSIATLLCVGCRTSRSSNPYPFAAAIEAVLASDVEAHRRTIGAPQNGQAAGSAASLVRTYTTRLREISFEKVPNEFHYAYMEHIHAWEEMRSLLEKSPTNGDASVLLGLLGIAAGQPKLGVPALVSGVQANASSKSKQDAERQVASDQIRQTWNKIELLVVKYGAKIPKAGGE